MSRMDVFIDRRMYLILLFIHCICFIVSQGKPTTPDIYYAVISSTAEFPCAAESPGDKLRWYSKNRDGSLRTRSSSQKDKDDPDLLVNVIKNVRLSDAGTFYCSDDEQSSSLELVVIEPSPVRDIQAQTTVPDVIKVTWRAPLNNPEALRGYNIYSTEVGESDKEAKFPVNSVKPDGDEEFDLTDFIPGATYEIQVAPLYRKGIDEEQGETVEGPRSPTVRIKTPEFEASPWKVKAEPWKNSSILVTWEPPKDDESRGVDGYIVHYQGIGKKGVPTGEVTVTRPGTDKRWSAVLKSLKTRMKYKIHVSAYTGGSQKVPAGKSQEVTIAHDGFNPELSIRALPLGPDSVLLTLDTVGGDKVEKLRLFYSDDSAISWEKVDEYNNTEKYAIVTGLEPRTRYFFMAKAAVNKKARSVVTHVMTPPSGLPTPTNVSVEATSDSSVHVAWIFDWRVPALGFIVRVEKEQPGGLFSQDKQIVVFKENEALIPELTSGEKYQVKVEPFDVEGVGSCSEPILFQLSAAGDTTTPAAESEAPQFLEEPPELLQINEDEDVRMTCTALGKPHPTVQWFKDGVPLGEPTDRTNQLTLSRVKDSTVLTCKASNDAGTAEKQTAVHVTRRLESEEPKLVETLPETLVVNRGGEIRQVCQATGLPLPSVTWYRNGTPVKTAENIPGRSVWTERRITRPLVLKCVASNPSGSTEGVIKVFVKDMLKKPTIRHQLQRIVEKNEGEQLTIPCAYSGHPVPEVSWYDGSTRLREPNTGQNLLKIDSVERTTTLTCRGENLQGASEETVQLIVRPRDRPAPSDYQVSVRHINESPLEVKVKWTVNRGNLKDIRYFDVNLMSEAGQDLIKKRLKSDQRSINLRQLSPQTRYIFNLLTASSRGVVDNSTITFIPEPPHSSNKEPVIFLDVLEIRDNEALVDFYTNRLDPRHFEPCKLYVKDLFVGPLGNTILHRRGLPLSSSIVIERLKPNSNYQVIVDTVSRNGSLLLEAVANFTTPGPGQYGTPVSTMSVSSTPTSQVPSTTNEVPTVTSTMPSTVTSIMPSTVTSTTASVVTSTMLTADISSTVETQDGSEDNDYVMTAKIPSKTDKRVDVRWTVNKGPLENIKSFLVTFKGERGRIMLEQELSADQRYITIQPLSPNTKYFVSVKAKGPDGVLAESDVAFQTDPANVVQDTSNPVLELEANEVRADNVRLEWTLLGAEPDLVKSYRLRVLDGGPDGTTLLNREVDANSPSLNLKQLNPSTRYHVIADALAADGSTVMTSSLTFETASLKNNGAPVRASSRAAAHPRQITNLAPQTEAATPELKLEVSPVGETSAQLNWRLENVPVRAVRGYTLYIRKGGPDGTILLSENMPFQQNNFQLDGLDEKRTYYLVLEAVSPRGSPIARAATPYVHRRSNSPFKVTSKQPESGPPLAGSHESMDNENEIGGDTRPKIDLELSPVGQGQVRVSWSVFGGSRSIPIVLYKIKVKEEGPQGRTVHENQLQTNTAFYTVSGLQENTNYYIELDALDSAGRVIDSVSSPYLARSAALRTSTVLTTATTAPNYDRGPDNSDVVITTAKVEGPTSIYLEWIDVTSHDGMPSSPTLIRYARSSSTDRGSFVNYYIELDALDSAGLVIESVSSPYLAPPAAAVRTSTVLTTATTAPNYDRGPDNSDVVITTAKVEGPTSIYLEWIDVTSHDGMPSSPTLIRYARSSSTDRGSFVIENAPDWQRHMTLRNLSPDSVYGIQVASRPRGSQYVRWSPLVFRKTEEDVKK